MKAYAIIRMLLSSNSVCTIVNPILLFFQQNCFELYIPNNRGQLIKACKTEADGRVVEGNHNVYRISAPTPEEKDEWIHSIKYGNKNGRIVSQDKWG